MKRPPHGVSLPCLFRRAIDGDTIEILFPGSERPYAIRLLDCWCPEMHEPGGPAAKAEAEAVLRHAEKLTVFIPLSDDLMHPLALFTLNRILGDIWINSYTTLSDYMVRKGFATAKKPPKGNPP